VKKPPVSLGFHPVVKWIYRISFERKYRKEGRLIWRATYRRMDPAQHSTLG
jgi:hypothetical protein